ncbi:hypothetical protein KQI65_09850 [bacterium]|nr:hypothetical protein [bacterium]
MTLTGIHNQNEFYSAHYLSDVFEGDVKDTLAEWTQRAKEDENFRAPFDAIGALRRDFFALQKELEGVKDGGDVLSIQSGFVRDLLTALGYSYHPQVFQAGDYAVTTIAAEQRSSGSALLWAIEVAGVNGDGGSNPLDLELHSSQYTEEVPEEQRLLGKPLEEVIDDVIYRMDEPPRWLLLCSGDMLVLVDRSKWNEKRLLSFDLREILDRRESQTLRAMAILLHRDCVAPGEGTPMLDTLDESAHKHAYAVSEDLKFSMREAVELLGNEAVWYLRYVSKEKVYDGSISPEQLSGECLRYIYRLLFLFFIEARPELGYAPMSSREYLGGYSLESLRDLEMLELESEEARDGSFIHQSLTHLFHLIYNGYNLVEQLQTDVLHDSFSMQPLKSHLFDPDRTPILSRVRFRNHVLQRIIRLMSLSRPKRGKRPGRISYARLGINQLGAVYEGLLSYTGFFAEEDMYEVKKKGKDPSPLERAFFVTEAELRDYEEEEKVLDEDGRVKKYEKGRFIYRLTGRSRETSASYYTPEVLTQCLVKYALKELFKEKSADDILHLKVCEPAMGSAAFLNEYVNQASEAYLQRKQKETGRVIPHDSYVREKQKVKAWLADNCAYGVDLNPVAVELAEVSLWLNTIHRESLVPWFGNQLVVGNSLIGARRQVFPISSLKAKKKDDLWLNLVPDRIMPGQDRPADTIYHFLLPDNGMANYNDKVVKAMVPDEIAKIRKWSGRGGFMDPPNTEEIKILQRLSTAIDGLWSHHIETRRRIEEETEDEIDIFGHEKDGGHHEKLNLAQKDRLLARELYGEGLENSSAYRRLKLVMDYWCALWFWPIQEADVLPSRTQYLEDLTLILEGRQEAVPDKPQSELFPESVDEKQQLELLERYGIIDVDELCDANPRLGIVRRIAAENTFLHWELEFAEIFADRGGFDLILGNPPWIKIEWNEGSVLGDADPRFVVRKHSSKQLADLREDTLDRLDLQRTYLDAFTVSEGTQNFLNGKQNYPLLQGMQSNLYKCFLPTAWMVGNEQSASGFLHPEGVYDDPKGGKLRAALYPRLRAHFQFQNALMLFPIAHREKYSLNIHSRPRDVKFITIANVFHPKIIDQCIQHDGKGAVPRMKNEFDEWDLRGHRMRVLEISEDELQAIARLSGGIGDCKETKLPSIHSKELLAALLKFGSHNHRLYQDSEVWYASEMWHETYAQEDNLIIRRTDFPETEKELIYSGPHFYINNPLYKTPKPVCTEKSHYDIIDHDAIDNAYSPRTNYLPNVSIADYDDKVPTVPWDSRSKVTDHYRLIFRKMMGPANERTMISAILHPGAGHIHSVLSVVFKDVRDMVLFAGLCSTIVFDFLIKTSGKTNVGVDVLGTLPFLTEYRNKVMLRALYANSITEKYSDLWNAVWMPSFTNDGWYCTDSRLSGIEYSKMNDDWYDSYVGLSDYARRWIQLELDVLVAKSLGLTYNELIAMYKIQFPVLYYNDNETWYDSKGKIIYTASRGLGGVGLDRSRWEEVKMKSIGIVSKTIKDETVASGPKIRTIDYFAPFTRCNREKDYQNIWTSCDP